MFSCSLGSQLFCAEKRQHKNFALVRERVRPITTLNESTLCSKIETHRRQIKTRKSKTSNEKSCTNRLLCRTPLSVWVTEGKEWTLLDFIRKLKMFVFQFFILIVLVVFTLATHSTDFIRHALHVIFLTQLSFPDFCRVFLISRRGKKGSWEKEIFHSDFPWKLSRKFSLLFASLSFYTFSAITNGRFFFAAVTFDRNGFSSNPSRLLSASLLQWSNKVNYQVYGPQKRFISIMIQLNLYFAH